MKVKCIETKGFKHLTLGKIYILHHVFLGSFYIDGDDNGDRHCYPSGHFELLPDEEIEEKMKKEK